MHLNKLCQILNDHSCSSVFTLNWLFIPAPKTEIPSRGEGLARFRRENNIDMDTHKERSMMKDVYCFYATVLVSLRLENHIPSLSFSKSFQEEKPVYLSDCSDPSLTKLAMLHVCCCHSNMT